MRMQFCCNEELMLLFKLLCSLEKEFVIESLARRSGSGQAARAKRTMMTCLLAPGNGAHLRAARARICRRALAGWRLQELRRAAVRQWDDRRVWEGAARAGRPARGGISDSPT